MANRMKEDEKNEKIIRGLLKLPANRRCINCNSLGPQYVCTNFWTFICTNCSGLHREFTHRVKSISMAKFTLQEVNALQEGGNERAREIYFKEWDPQLHSVPDSSNIDRFRDFIKHVYVDLRYTGERSIDRPPRVKGDREDYNEKRMEDSYRGGSRSPPYDDMYERRYSERPGSGGRNDDRKFRPSYEQRSPGYDQNDYKRSPVRFEVIDERRQDDKSGNGNQNQRFEDRRSPDGVPRPDGRSPNNQKDVDAYSPPVVRPVRDILGGDIPPLRVSEPPKSNGIRPPDSYAHAQKTASSSSRGSSDGNSVELKKVNFESLIDFDEDPKPPVAVAPHQSAPQQTGSPANGGNWASFDVPPQQNAPQVGSHGGHLESALAQLSAPGSVPAVSFSTLPIAGGQWPALQPQQQLSQFQPADSRSTNPPFNAPIDHSWGPSLAPNLQVPFNAPSGQSSQAVTEPHHETSAAGISQPPVEAKPSGRKELPEDLFAAIYLSTPASAPGWQTSAHLGMGYGMQYPSAATMPTFPQPAISKNPFDLVKESTLSHAPMFPSMASLQGALPNVNNPPASLHSSSFGAPPRWVPPQQASYPSAVSTSSYMLQQRPSNMPQQQQQQKQQPSLYPSSLGSSNMPQQLPNNFFPMGHQGIGGFGSGGAPFGPSAFNQHSPARNSQLGAPNSFVHSVGGNPFG